MELSTLLQFCIYVFIFLRQVDDGVKTLSFAVIDDQRMTEFLGYTSTISFTSTPVFVVQEVVMVL